MVHEHDHDGPASPGDWDERYADEEQVWSGQPNGALVAETSDLAPGRALDVACGEGADAIWLAARGWTVRAVDVSRVAIDRAARAATDAGVTVSWLCADVTDPYTELGLHDLVSCQYPALPKTDETVTRLLAAVAPGGTLLFVHHADLTQIGHEHGFDPDDYVQPNDVRGQLDDSWVIEVDETRPRPGPLPPDARHTDDVVLRARRSS